MQIKHSFACAALAFAACGAQAQWAPSGFFVEGSFASERAHSVTAGLVWPMDWRRETESGLITLQTEALIGQWSGKAPFGGGRVSFTQVALQPVFRYHFGKMQDAWFVEGGIGLSYTDKPYVTQNKTFSTRFNFKDTIGFGKNFGDRGEHELGVRITHYSNAGIKHPNPGENFLQLRYAKAF